jgi:hypothetical protein
MWRLPLGMNGNAHKVSMYDPFLLLIYVCAYGNSHSNFTHPSNYNIGKIIPFPHTHLFHVSPLNNYRRNKLKLTEEQIPEIGNKQTI